MIISSRAVYALFMSVSCIMWSVFSTIFVWTFSQKLSVCFSVIDWISMNFGYVLIFSLISNASRQGRWSESLVTKMAVLYF